MDALVSGAFQQIGVWQQPRGRHRALGLYRAVQLTLCYLRNNIAQDVLAEFYGCSQATVSRVIAGLCPVITAVLTEHAQQTAARQLRSTTRIDGFLARVGNHRAPHRNDKMWSKRRRADGFNIQILSSHEGRLVAVGKPVPGATHDAKAWHHSGLARRLHGRLHRDGGPGVIGDLAYLGTGVLTGFRRRPDRRLSISERELNRSISSWRAPAERTVAHMKNWKILAIGYRGMLERFPAILETITALEVYRAWSAF